jgi:hypothetical protein
MLQLACDLSTVYAGRPTDLHEFATGNRRLHRGMPSDVKTHRCGYEDEFVYVQRWWLIRQTNHHVSSIEH